MYNMTKLVTRYFKVKLKINKTIDVEPPKLKVFREISKLASMADDYGESEIDSITKAVSLALSKNRQRYKVSPDQIENWLNYDELYDLLLNYFKWVGEVTNSKN